MLKKIIKILLFSFTILIALVLLVIFLAGAGFLNGFIASEIPELAGKSINGKLSIGSISGKLFSHFIIHDISVASGTDTLLKCRSIEVEYVPGRLLHKSLDITVLRIENPVLSLKQEDDSSWNFMKIMKTNNNENDTSSNASTWKIWLENFSLENLSAGIAALDTGSIPSFINCNIQLKASFSSDTISATIGSAQVVTGKPDFEIVNLTGEIKKERSHIQWNNVSLMLRNTAGKTDGWYNIDDGSAEAKLHFSPLAFEDFTSFFKGMNLFGHPRLEASVSGNPAEYSFSLNVTEEDQKIDLSGKIRDLHDDPSYSAVIEASGLDGSFWTHDKNLKSDISGRMEIKGKGFNMRENEIMLKGQFGNLDYGGYNLTGLSVNAEKKKDEVSGDLSTGTFVGYADIKFDLSDVFGNPAYSLNAGYREINIGKLPGLDSISSSLNGTLSLKGMGNSPQNLKAKISLKSFNSKIDDQKIDDFELEGTFDKGNYVFNIPHMETPFFGLEAEGHGNIKLQNDISFSFEPKDLYGILRYFGMPEANVSGRISGNVSGTSDALAAKLTLDLSDIYYDSIHVRNLKSEVDATRSERSYKGNVFLTSDSISYGSFTLKSAGVKAELSGKSIKADVQVNVNDSLSGAFRGTIEGLESPLVRINDLDLNHYAGEWHSIGDSAFVKLEKNAIYINEFGMASGDQEIKVTGKFAFSGDEDISLSINNVQLASLPLESYLPYDLSGNVSVYVNLKGTSSAPMIDASLSADSLFFDKYQADSVRLKMNYTGEILSAEGAVDFGQREPLKIAAKIPVRISLSDSMAVLKNRPGFFASVSLDSLDLDELSSLIPSKAFSVTGIASARAEVNNSINDPDIKGSFDLERGGVKSKDMGIDYRNMRLSAVVDSNKLRINQFIAESGKGKLSVSGSISLDSKDSLNAEGLRMNLNASDFQALKSDNAELNFNSDIGITGSFARPEMKGSVKINSSKFNVDYFTSKSSQVKDDLNPPLLEQALQDTVNITVPSDTTSGNISGISPFRNLAGEITIDIPGNTWVTGKDMNFELDGTLRAVKSSPEISLFGDLNVKRGYYKIYGRKFDFNKGTITFTGGTEFNPDLDVEIVYRFRDIEKNMRDLKLNIKGRLMQPQYAFMLDNEAIEEKDAISYIAFGKSINQLGEGEKEKMSGQDIALGVAVTQLSSVLKGILQEEAGIDVFEFTGGDDWKSGSVTIGKYITNKLYISYERNFDFDKQRKTSVTEKIMLEYQILRNFILKATNQDVNSGFDLIFKKTWK